MHFVLGAPSCPWAAGHPCIPVGGHPIRLLSAGAAALHHCAAALQCPLTPGVAHGLLGPRLLLVALLLDVAVAPWLTTRSFRPPALPCCGIGTPCGTPFPPLTLYLLEPGWWSLFCSCRDLDPSPVARWPPCFISASGSAWAPREAGLCILHPSLGAARCGGWVFGSSAAACLPSSPRGGRSLGGRVSRSHPGPPCGAAPSCSG